MTAKERLRFWTPWIVVTIAISAMLLAALPVVLDYLTRPQEVMLTIYTPAGHDVICDLVVDGRAESHVDKAPVTYNRRCHDFSFAVIAADPAAGPIAINFKTNGGAQSGTAAEGFVGDWKNDRFRGTIRLRGMTSTHVRTMRTAAIARQPTSLVTE